MKKLRLDPDALRVETFAAAPSAEVRGTVVGHLPETHPRACPFTQNWWCTGGATCTLYIEYCIA
jgi:hypothetical protein